MESAPTKELIMIEAFTLQDPVCSVYIMLALASVGAAIVSHYRHHMLWVCYLIMTLAYLTASLAHGVTVSKGRAAYRALNASQPRAPQSQSGPLRKLCAYRHKPPGFAPMASGLGSSLKSMRRTAYRTSIPAGATAKSRLPPKAI
jgi:hypothetical protein